MIFLILMIFRIKCKNLESGKSKTLDLGKGSIFAKDLL